LKLSSPSKVGGRSPAASNLEGEEGMAKLEVVELEVVAT
jgi:hypothetical protein